MTSAVEEVVVPSLGGGGCGCGGGGRKRKCDCNHFPVPVPVPVPDAESDSEDEILEDGIVSSDEEDEKVDPFVDSYGRHVITNNEYRRYSRQVSESGGFHVDKLPNTTMIGAIQPFDVNHCYGKLKGYAELAIQRYNKKQNANLEFVNLVKVNAQLVRGTRYYITFLAKDSSGDERNYQALVWDGIWEVKVRLCRPEPIKQGEPKKSRLHAEDGN